MKEIQLRHQDITNPTHDREIVLIAEQITSPTNYGMLLRTAEAFGVQKVIFISEEYTSLTTKMKRSSRSTEKYVQVAFETDLQFILNDLQQNDFEILALEITNKSIPIERYCNENKKIALICGNESVGVSQKVIDASDAAVHIPMFGKNSSMNVVVSVGVALSHLVLK